MGRNVGTSVYLPRREGREMMKVLFPAMALVLMLMLGTSACEENACSPCAPGSYPSNPSQHCSACVPCPDAGVNASSGSVAAIWCAMGQPTPDAPSESDGDAANVDATDAGGHCSPTNDHASFRVYPGDGTIWMCNPPHLLIDGSSDAATPDGGLEVQPTDGGVGPAPINTLRGMITGGDASSLVIDSCDGSPSCVSNSIRIEINAPGLDLTTVPRVRVEVKFQIKFFYYCQESLQITALDPVDGSASNPPAGRLLLAVVDGGSAFSGSTYTATQVALGCFSGQSTGSVAPDNYAFDFRMAGDNGSALRVYMGETQPWMTVGQSYKVRNLRSFQSIASDDFGNFAYYIVAAP
jgi:hypothetical protein